jgi:acetyltransferase-like isoleucine patch superfamily enzyme
MGELLRLRHRLRRLWILGRLRLVGKLKRAELHLDVAPDIEFGERVTFRILAGSRNSLTIGPGCRIFEDVLFQLKGAIVHFGERVEIRRGTVFNLSGSLTLIGHNVISYSNVIHCADSITFDVYSCTNEYVSIIDSTHHHDGASEFFYENTSAAPIEIGKNVWICNKASVLLGVRVGHNSVVASHSVVNKDVPEGVVVGGLPAKVIAPRRVGGPATRFFTVDHVSV